MLHAHELPILRNLQISEELLQTIKTVIVFSSIILFFFYVFYSMTRDEL